MEFWYPNNPFHYVLFLFFLFFFCFLFKEMEMTFFREIVSFFHELNRGHLAIHFYFIFVWNSFPPSTLDSLPLWHLCILFRIQLVKREWKEVFSSFQQSVSTFFRVLVSTFLLLLHLFYLFCTFESVPLWFSNKRRHIFLRRESMVIVLHFDIVRYKYKTFYFFSSSALIFDLHSE